jgi:hypothetical protein
MKRARIGVIATAVLAVATMAFAQKPDFSGTWTPDAAAAPAGTAGAAPAGGAPAGGAMGGGQMGGGRGMMGPMTVKQSGDSLAIEREGRNGKTTTTYKLDGSESKNPGRGGAEQVSIAKWDGNKLVITTKGEQGDTTQTWSLEGGTLTIERTGGPASTKTTYKKTT